MGEHLKDLDSGLEEISKDFEAGKEIIESLEQLVRKEEVTYDKHVERLQSLRFLYLKLMEWRDLRAGDLRRMHAEQEKQELFDEIEAEVEDAEDFDPMA